MRQTLCRWAAPLLVAVVGVGAVGCGNDAKPNPSLQVPEVAPGRHGGSAKKTALTPPGKKQPGRR